MKGTEISLRKFVLEHFTTLTLDIQTGVVSDEDITEIWEVVKEDTLDMVRGNKNRTTGADSPVVVEKEVEKSLWVNRPDGWVIKRKMKKIVLLEFKITTDSSESYYQDMWKVSEQQDTPILTGLRVLKCSNTNFLYCPEFRP